jgi:hypothetical protein
MSPVVETRNELKFFNNKNSTPAPNHTAIKITQVDLNKKTNLTQYDDSTSLDIKSKMSGLP